MAIADDKSQVSIILPKKVLEWAVNKSELIFKTRSTFLSDIIIQEYLKDLSNNDNTTEK